MTDTVLTAIEGRTGIITLNRPQAINALNREMIEGVTAAFTRFTADDSIAAILLEGAGERGFCSGGDVRSVRELALAGDHETADGFFAAEYALNGMIANARKPVVALTSGVVMGGGIGLAGHAHYRIAADNAKFAMPEGAIGFFCDVGADWILAKAPLHRALAFELCGQAVGAEDARALGLTDCVVAGDDLGSVRADLIAAIAEGDVATSVVSTMQAHDISGGDTPFIALADRLEGAFSAADAAGVMATLEALAAGDEEAAELLIVMNKRCPTSLVAIHASQTQARRAGSVDAVLTANLALAGLMVRRADFAEGVRAVLVDKDHAPQWSPADISEVSRQEIDNSLDQPSTNKAEFISQTAKN